MNKIKYNKAFSFAFKYFFSNFGHYVKITQIFALTTFILEYINQAIKTLNIELVSSHSSIALTLSVIFIRVIINFIVTLLCFFNDYEITKNMFDKNIEIEKNYHLFRLTKNKLRFTVALMIYYIRTFFGLIFLILPGLYLAAKYFFVGYSIIEQNNSVKEDKRYTSNISKGKILNILFYGLCIVSIKFVTMLPALLGIIFNTSSGSFFIGLILSILTAFLYNITVLANFDAYKQLILNPK